MQAHVRPNALYTTLTPSHFLEERPMRAKPGRSLFVHIAGLLIGGILTYRVRGASFLACVLHASPIPKRQTAVNVHSSVLGEVGL